MTPTTATLVDLYLDFLRVERRLTAPGLTLQAQDLVRLLVFAHTRGVPVERLSADDLETYLVADVAAGSIGGLSALGTLTEFFRFLVIDRRIAVDPMRALLRRKTPAGATLRAGRRQLAQLEAL